jgi:hypothetical protein
VDWTHETNATKKLVENACEKCRKKHGLKTAERLHILTTIIDNSTNFSDFNTTARVYGFNPHSLENINGKDYEGFWAYSINDRLRAILRPNIGSAQTHKDNATYDYKQITSVSMVSIEDYHTG